MCCASWRRPETASRVRQSRCCAGRRRPGPPLRGRPAARAGRWRTSRGATSRAAARNCCPGGTELGQLPEYVSRCNNDAFGGRRVVSQLLRCRRGHEGGIARSRARPRRAAFRVGGRCALGALESAVDGGPTDAEKLGEVGWALLPWQNSVAPLVPAGSACRNVAPVRSSSGPTARTNSCGGIRLASARRAWVRAGLGRAG